MTGHLLALGAFELEREGVVGARDEVGQSQPLGVLVGDAAARDDRRCLGQEGARRPAVDRILERADGLGALEDGRAGVQRRQDRCDVVQEELLAPVGEGDAALVEQHRRIGECADHTRMATQRPAQERQDAVGQRDGVDRHAQLTRIRRQDLEVRVRVLRGVFARVHAEQREPGVVESLAEGLDRRFEHGGGALVARQG